MESIGEYITLVDALEFTGNRTCFEKLDSVLQDLIFELTREGYRTTGELIDLKGCSWVLHERYYMEDYERLKWTFHHTKYRILKNSIELMNKQQAREGNGLKIETRTEAA